MSALVEGCRGSKDPLVLSDSANHWQHIGLENSPFDDSLAVYYPVPQWEEHLRYLQQFRSASYPLLLIPGIVGSGKTTLIKHFVESQNDPTRIHYIEAQPHHAVNQFIQTLYANSGMEAPQDNNSDLLYQLTLLAREVGPQLLLIDNAHRLSRETLMRLLHLVFSQDLTQTQFRVVLSGESQLQETVMNLLDTFASSRQVPSLQLEPLSIQEVREYLEFRFEEVGLNQRLPFTPALLKQIHLLSGGFPGRVNRVAQQVFVDAMKNDYQPEMPTGSTVNQFIEGHKMKLIGIAVFLALVLLVWNFQSQSNSEDKAGGSVASVNTEPNQKDAIKSAPKQGVSRSELSQEERRALATAVDRMQSAEMAQNEDYEESFSMPVARNQHLLAGAVMADSKTVYLAKKSAGDSSTVEQKASPEVVATSDPDESQEPRSVVASTDSVQQERRTFVMDSPDSAQTEKSASEKATNLAASDSVTGAELQLMASKGYTIQIMGVREPQLLEAFIAENQLTDVSYYRTKMNHQDWYVLVHGSYQSQDEARAALSKLPAAVRKQQPWVRSFDGVRQAIELAHQKEAPKESPRVAVR
jgi:DamX protein